MVQCRRAREAGTEHAVAKDANFLACNMEARIMRSGFSSITRLLAPVAATAVLAVSSAAWAQTEQPNILVIWGDDIGQSNISAYTMGLVGYRTPNIDRIAQEGMIFTDYYGENSCTAGRSALICCAHRPIWRSLRPISRHG